MEIGPPENQALRGRALDVPAPAALYSRGSMGERPDESRAPAGSPRMRTIRVVIVDGDPAIRRKLGRAIQDGPGLDLVGASGFGTDAVEKVGRLQPDLVVLGIDASVSDEWETLGLLRKAHPELPILVVGPETRRGSPAALDAIDRGASACVAYPDTDDAEALRGVLLPRLRAGAGLARRPVPSRSRPRPGAPSPRPRAGSRPW